MAESFHRSFGLPVTIVRPFNTYGPRQSARAIIPTIITQLLSGAYEIKLGSLTPTRDFNYVLDTVAGFYAISQSEQTIGEEINIATQDEISMLQLAETLIEQINPRLGLSAMRSGSDRRRVRSNRLLVLWQDQGPDWMVSTVHAGAGTGTNNRVDAAQYGSLQSGSL